MAANAHTFFSKGIDPFADLDEERLEAEVALRAEQQAKEDVARAAAEAAQRAAAMERSEREAAAAAARADKKASKVAKKPKRKRGQHSSSSDDTSNRKALTSDATRAPAATRASAATRESKRARVDSLVVVGDNDEDEDNATARADAASAVDPEIEALLRRSRELVSHVQYAANAALSSGSQRRRAPRAVAATDDENDYTAEAVWTLRVDTTVTDKPTYVKLPESAPLKTVRLSISASLGVFPRNLALFYFGALVADDATVRGLEIRTEADAVFFARVVEGAQAQATAALAAARPIGVRLEMVGNARSADVEPVVVNLRASQSLRVAFDYFVQQVASPRLARDPDELASELHVEQGGVIVPLDIAVGLLELEVAGAPQLVVLPRRCRPRSALTSIAVNPALLRPAVRDGAPGALLSEDGPRVVLFVRNAANQSQKFLIPREKPLSVLMNHYCEQAGIELDAARFRFDGEVLQPTDTAADLDIDNESIIDVTVKANAGAA